MSCKICGDLNKDCDTLILKGGYIVTLCNDCLNDFQEKFNSTISSFKQARYYYLDNLEKPTMEDAQEYINLTHEFFDFSKNWANSKIDESEVPLSRIEMLWKER